MASWCPATPLEEEIVALQPEHHFIYGDLTDQEKHRETYRPRPRDHLQYLRNKKTVKASEKNEIEMPGGCSLSVIRAVHEMTGNKGMGINANIEDWNTRENVENETIAMIRSCGMGPSSYSALDKKLTLPTLPIPKRSYVMKDGEILFPVLLDNDSFKVVSTRMLNAESAKGLQEETKDSNLEEDIRALPCEEENIETIEEAKERELKEFLVQYPTLEQHKTKSTKSKQNNNNKNTKNKLEQENWRVRNSSSSSSSLNTTPTEVPNNWRSKTTTNTSSEQKQTNWRTQNSQNSSNLNYSSICNTSNDSSNASFLSYSTSNSDDYVSAKEFLDNSNSDQLQPNEKSFSKVVKQHSSPPQERLPRGKKSSKELNSRLYTPRDVYNLKKSNQRK